MAPTQPWRKTASGRTEVRHRSGCLGSRERSVLILSDGRRDDAALAARQIDLAFP